MKKHRIPLIFSFTLALLAMQRGSSFSAANTGFDKMYTPIQVNTLPNQLMDASSDEAKLMDLISRAIFQNYGVETYHDMDYLVNTHRKDMNLLQGMYFCDAIAHHDYVIGITLNIPNTEPPTEYFDGSMFGSIMHNSWHPWLALMVNGIKLMDYDKDYRPGMAELQQAEIYRPDLSITHLALAFEYARPNMAFYNNGKFASEALQAYKCNPGSSRAAMYVYDYYAAIPNDAADAAKWRAIVKSLTPDESKFPPNVRKWLDFGLSPPKTSNNTENKN